MRDAFVHELQNLKDSIFILSEMVNNALLQSVEALKLKDTTIAQLVIDEDNKINSERFLIESKSFGLIATQQPVAHDLRFIGSALIIANELERMGDHAKGIATISLLLTAQPLVAPLVNIPLMTEKCKEMLNAAMDAFKKDDAGAAMEVARRDDEIDLLYDKIYLDMINLMTENQANINGATHVLWIAHNLERFADRIVNICERIIYIVTGELREIAYQRPSNLEVNQISAKLELNS